MRILVFLLTLLCLSGCMDAQCIEADDFGFAKFKIPAKRNSKDVFGDVDNQVSKWINTGYVLTGDPLVVIVKNWNYKDDGNIENSLSAWCPWYGSRSGASAIGAFFDPSIPAFPNALSYMCKNMAVCKWRNSNDMCSTEVSGSADIMNAPCLLTQGVGLYALLTSPGFNPNATVNNMRDPAGTAGASGARAVAIHVGDPNNQLGSGYNLYDVDKRGKYTPAGGVVYKDAINYLNGGLYFKILDKHYGDNSGQYLIVVKSGLDYDAADPIQFITKLVATYFFGNSKFLGDTDNKSSDSVKSIIQTPRSQGVVESLYKALIQNPYYKNIVRASLSLYIVLMGLYYLAGLLEITRSEIITRVIKVALISALLDPNLGWSFFHDYLFVYFIEGVQYLVSTIQSAGSNGPGSSSILALMMAPETLVKLASILFTNWLGLFYIIIYLLIFIFLWSILFRAAVLYLNCLIMIGMIIILGPIFLCFMLFGFTRSLYENWLKQLIGYALRPIILITILTLMSMLVRHEIYTTLGFPVCKFTFPNFGPNLPVPGINNLFYWWLPSPNPLGGSNFSNNKAVIPVPEAHMQLDSNGNETGRYCRPYECYETRYPQLPFLDPNNRLDMQKKNNFFGGSFVQINSLLFIIVLIYLLNKANESAETVAKAITETSGNATNLPKASIPYIPYDTPSKFNVAGKKSGGEEKERPEINVPPTTGTVPSKETSTPLIKTGELAKDGVVVKSKEQETKAPLLLTKATELAKDGVVVQGKAPEVGKIGDLAKDGVVIKSGSKDDISLTNKSNIKLSKRAEDDIKIGTKKESEIKVTLDFKAEAARVKAERVLAVDGVVVNKAEKPVLASNSPIKLESAQSSTTTIKELPPKPEATVLAGAGVVVNEAEKPILASNSPIKLESAQSSTTTTIKELPPKPESTVLAGAGVVVNEAEKPILASNNPIKLESEVSKPVTIRELPPKPEATKIEQKVPKVSEEKTELKLADRKESVNPSEKRVTYMDPTELSESLKAETLEQFKDVLENKHELEMTKDRSDITKLEPAPTYDHVKSRLSQPTKASLSHAVEKKAEDPKSNQDNKNNNSQKPDKNKELKKSENKNQESKKGQNNNKDSKSHKSQLPKSNPENLPPPPDYSNVKSKLGDETTATKAHSKAGEEIRENIKENAAAAPKSQHSSPASSPRDTSAKNEAVKPSIGGAPASKSESSSTKQKDSTSKGVSKDSPNSSKSGSKKKPQS